MKNQLSLDKKQHLYAKYWFYRIICMMKNQHSGSLEGVGVTETFFGHCHIHFPPDTFKLNILDATGI
jgi:hypothetical protein